MKQKDIKIKKIIRLIQFIIIFIMCVVFIINKDKVTISSISNITPHQLFLGALVIIAIYALKSLSVMFPIILIIAAGGYVFGFARGIVINIIGVAVCVSVPYWMGRVTSSNDKERIINRYPKLQGFVEGSEGKPFVSSLFLRTLIFMPFDIVSLYMGTVKAHYAKYVAGSLAGFMPVIIFMTVAGLKLTDPSSKEFVGCVIAQVIITIISILIYFITKKKKRT